MSRYGSVTISSPASLITRIVQSSIAGDLAARTLAAISALPAGYTIVGITLAGAGDGHTFTVTIEAGANVDVIGGITGVTTTCFQASEAEALLLARVAAAPAAGTFADTQVAGASKGTMFMGLNVNGIVASGGGGGACPPLNYQFWVGVTTPPTAVPTGSACDPFPTITAALAAAAATPANSRVGILIAAGDYSVESPIAIPSAVVRAFCFETVGGVATVPGWSLDTSAGTFELDFRDVDSQSFNVTGGAQGTECSIAWRASGGFAGQGPTVEIPAIDDSLFGGVAILVTLQGGVAITSWNFSTTTDVTAWGTQFGYPQSDTSFQMSVRSFQWAGSCRFQDAGITVTQAPVANSGGVGFEGCVFAGGGNVFTGPAGSFVGDNSSISIFLAVGGILAGGATFVRQEHVVPGFEDAPAFNLGVSASALTSLAGGTNDVGVGTGALNACTTGSYNTAVGDGTLGLCTTGSYNTAVGSGTLGFCDTGTQNTAVGALALASASSASGNTAVGYRSLNAMLTGTFNTAVGQSSMENATGTNNTGFGAFTLVNSTGDSNTAVGYAALSTNSTGLLNTAVGGNALITNTTGTENVSLGAVTLQANLVGNRNTAAGTNALRDSIASDNVGVGYNALGTTTAGELTAVGSQALSLSTTGIKNTAVGFQALATITTADFNTAVGHRALTACTSGYQNVGVGRGVLSANTTGAHNVGVGDTALAANTTGLGHVAVGSAALSSVATVVVGLTAIGFQALASNTTGQESTAIGYGSLGACSVGNYNTAVGSRTLIAATGDENTVVGYHAAISLTSGSNNTVIGSEVASTTLTTGSRNILIGTSVSTDTPTAGTSDYLNVGNAITGDLTPGAEQITFRLVTTAGITASIVQAQGSQPLTSNINEISVCATPGDTVTLPSAIAGFECIVINNGANALQVFPALGDNLGAGVNLPTTQVAGVTFRYVAYDATNWVIA